MSLSFEEITGKVVSRIIERNKKDITVIMLIANDGREIIIKRDKNSAIDIPSFLDQSVVATGSIEGNFFTPHEITKC